MLRNINCLSIPPKSFFLGNYKAFSCYVLLYTCDQALPPCFLSQLSSFSPEPILTEATSRDRVSLVSPLSRYCFSADSWCGLSVLKALPPCIFWVHHLPHLLLSYVSCALLQMCIINLASNLMLMDLVTNFGIQYFSICVMVLWVMVIYQEN